MNYKNKEYSATVVKIDNIIKLDNCDNVVATKIFGYQAIVGKESKIGDIGIVFGSETQLSHDYCKENNLYRHNFLNVDESKTGYIEDNRRIKAVKFRKNPSNCLFMPLESLSWTGIDISKLNEGDIFDELNGKEICRKYVSRGSKQGAVGAAKIKVENKSRVQKKHLPDHYDTENYWRNKHMIPDDAFVTVTDKLHGTSFRAGHTIVARKLSWIEKLAKKFGVTVQETEFDYVFGSRKVIKDPNNPFQNHYYDTDIWTDAGKKLIGLIPKNYLVYGELIGWTPTGGAIQGGYTYNLPVKNYDMYIYRVAFVNEDGLLSDLTWDQIKHFCNERELKHVPELWSGLHKDFNVDDWIDIKYFESGFKQAVPLCKESPCDEGVCVRMDGLRPVVLKAKSPAFLQFESKELDKDILDIESEQSIE